MKITILGCGPSGGVPTIGGADEQGFWGSCNPDDPKNKRTRSSIVVEDLDATRILVDCGPDLRYQLLHAQMARFDAMIVTHAHADHIGGFDDVRGINLAISSPLPLFASQETLTALEERFPYAFKPWDGGPFFRPVPAPQIITAPSTFYIKNTPLTVFPQRHFRIETLGLRFKKFAYSTDVEHLSESSLKILKGVDTWVVGCLQLEPHIAHASLAHILKWRELIKPRRTILTHMGVKLDYQTLCNMLPEGVEPAYDGMTLSV